MSSGETAPTPAPTGTDPSPLTVGTQFVKKYYHVLSTSPADIDKFYKSSTSIVTRGEGSDTAEIITTDFSDGAAAARFFTSDDEQIRFEFEHGAIDAQFSVNSAILLVVTGQVVYVTSGISKSFVHTFFLGSTIAGPSTTKRSYYVHNDILRFLAMQQSQVGDTVIAQVNDAPTLDETSAVVLIEKIEEPTDMIEDGLMASEDVELTPTDEMLVERNGKGPPAEKEETVVAGKTVVDAKVDKLDNSDAPGYGVEESKVAVLDDEVSATTKSTSAPATSGSWASLVKRTAPTSASPPATPMRSEKPSTASANGATAIPQQPAATTVGKVALEPSIQHNVTSAAGTSSKVATPAPTSSDASSNKTAITAKQQQAQTHQQFRPKREAECTLIIKNIDMDVTEAEIKSMFEPFIADTSANYVGCTVQGQRGIAFVDFDAPEPVVKAVKQHTEVKFTIRGRELDIYQKVFVDKTTQHRGGGNRFQGNSNNNGRDFYRSGGGGGADGSGRNGGRNFRRGSGRAAGRSASAVTSSGDNN